MVRVRLYSHLFVFSLLAACGGNSSDSEQDPSEPNEPALTCGELPPAGSPGGPCTDSSDCDSSPGAGDGQCLNRDSGWPEEGYCILVNGCRLDSECPAGSVCTAYNFQGACMPQCCEVDGELGCSEGRLCGRDLEGEHLHRDVCLPANTAGEDGDPCQGIDQCNANSECLIDQLTSPGGVCRTVNCFNNDDCAGEGSVCVPLGGNNESGCFPGCASDADCRTDDGYFCDDRMETPVCRHGEAGDACTEDRHCGGAPWVCLTGPNFPGGYCSVQECDPEDLGGCPDQPSSYCYDGDVTPYCAYSCNPGNPDDCRPGYSCIVSNDSDAENPVYGCIAGAAPL